MEQNLRGAYSQHIGARIRLARVARDLTQEDLAWKVGITQAHLSKIELQKQRPGADLLGAFASVLGVSVGFFYGEDPARISSQELAEISNFLVPTPENKQK